MLLMGSDERGAAITAVLQLQLRIVHIAADGAAACTSSSIKCTCTYISHLEQPAFNTLSGSYYALSAAGFCAMCWWFLQA
jgi:hypothetical protein